jgi:hypothetical protein
MTSVADPDLVGSGSGRLGTRSGSGSGQKSSGSATLIMTMVSFFVRNGIRTVFKYFLKFMLGGEVTPTLVKRSHEI